eukprot:364304-Chlamydomonas_euryale.AAC.2
MHACVYPCGRMRARCHPVPGQEVLGFQVQPAKPGAPLDDLALGRLLLLRRCHRAHERFDLAVQRGVGIFGAAPARLRWLAGAAAVAAAAIHAAGVTAPAWADASATGADAAAGAQDLFHQYLLPPLPPPLLMLLLVLELCGGDASGGGLPPGRARGGQWQLRTFVTRTAQPQPRRRRRRPAGRHALPRRGGGQRRGACRVTRSVEVAHARDVRQGRGAARR